MKKVVFLSPLPPPYGGIAVWADRLRQRGKYKGWEFHFIDEKIIGGRNVFGDNKKKNLLCELHRCLSIWKKLFFYLRDENVFVIHVSIPATKGAMIREIVSMTITNMFKKRFIIHYRCTTANIVNSKSSLFIYKFLSTHSFKSIVLNEKSRLFNERLGIINSVVVPNFVGNEYLDLFNKRIINREIRKIIYVGGVTKEKGCDIVLDSAKYFPDIQFEFIGNPESAIKCKGKQLENVLFSGEMDQAYIKDRLLASDLFVFCSNYIGEGFSNALLEAMATGIPCIVSDWAANKDMIENKGGIVLRDNNYICLNEAIENVFDYELRQNMSIWNHNKVVSSYKLETVLDEYTSLYGKGINNEIKN